MVVVVVVVVVVVGVAVVVEVVVAVVVVEVVVVVAVVVVVVEANLDSFFTTLAAAYLLSSIWTSNLSFLKQEISPDISIREQEGKNLRHSPM